MKFLPFLIWTLFWAYPCFGQDVQWRADHLQRQVFSYPKVCQMMGVAEAPLITAAGMDLDCMNTKVSLADFCLAQGGVKPFLRAVARDQQREVTCEYGLRGILELSCTRADCHHPAEQCQTLRRIYARQLELVHSGVWAGSTLPRDDISPLIKGDLPPAAADPLNIFAFAQLKLECIYEARASFWGHDDGRL